MEKANEVTLVFDSRPVNEALARITAASFCTQLNPTLEEVADLKTAVSEAVTNSIIHAYAGEIHKIEMKLCITDQEICVEITDHGKGITIGRYGRRIRGKKVRWTCTVMVQK